MVHHVQAYAEHLSQRLGRGAAPAFKNIPNLPELPVIPLGVESITPAEEMQKARPQWRKKCGLSENTMAFLFMGRLSFHAKAHPVPMFEALERASRDTTQPIALILCEWFASDTIEKAFRDAANTICPSVNIVMVDGRDPEVRQNIWSAGDAFISLVDNVQETFGLTPLEAMAHGLPVIVSDWNGYRDTVRHGIDGFRVRTTAPHPGRHEGLAMAYACGDIDYDHYLAESCRRVVVDVEEAAHQALQLCLYPDLRQRMGDAGRSRVQEAFLWSNIVQRYLQLMDHLKEKRLVAPPQAPPVPRHPLRQDPFMAFSGYPTKTLQENTTFTLSPTPHRPEQLAALGVYRAGYPMNLEKLKTLEETIAAKPGLSYGDLLRHPPFKGIDLDLYLTFLAKNGWVRIDHPT